MVNARSSRTMLTVLSTHLAASNPGIRIGSDRGVDGHLGIWADVAGWIDILESEALTAEAVNGACGPLARKPGGGFGGSSRPP
jgi:hypothetical protein